MPIQALLDSALDVVIVTDGSGKIVSINARTETLLPIEAHDLVGRPIESLIPKRFRERHAAQRIAHSSAPAPSPIIPRLNVTGRRRDGSEVGMEVELVPVEAGPDILLCAIIREPVVAAPPDAANILVVADDSAEAAATSMLLQVEGYRVTAAPSAEEALADIASAELPDVIVCDVSRSDAGAGADAVMSIRAATGKIIPGVVISYDAPTARVQPPPACRFLAKSIYPSELIDEIQRLLAA